MRSSSLSGPSGRLHLLAALALVLALPLAGMAGSGAFQGPAELDRAFCPDAMTYVPAGPFFGGASPEQVEVSDYVPDIARDPRPRGQHGTAAYCIDRHEFPGKGKPPVANVTWLQARVACSLRGARLCTEDEWSKACGGVLGTLYPYGDLYIPGLCHAEVEEEGSYDRVEPGGSRPHCTSPYGVHDLEGNVSEWVEDPRDGAPWDRWVLGGTMWRGVYGRGCQARHAHPAVAPVAGDDGFRCCQDLSN